MTASEENLLAFMDQYYAEAVAGATSASHAHVAVRLIGIALPVYMRAMTEEMKRGAPTLALASAVTGLVAAIATHAAMNASTPDSRNDFVDVVMTHAGVRAKLPLQHAETIGMSAPLDDGA